MLQNYFKHGSDKNMLLVARPPLKVLWNHWKKPASLLNKQVWGGIYSMHITSLPHSPAGVGMVTFVCLWRSAPGRSADPLPVCVVLAHSGTEPARLCAAGSHRCPGSVVENEQVLCQCCQKNLQLLSAPITRRRWIASLNSVPDGSLAAGRL